MGDEFKVGLESVSDCDGLVEMRQPETQVFQAVTPMFFRKADARFENPGHQSEDFESAGGLDVFRARAV